MTAPTVLLVLAKAPHPGRVKTRLCPPCTPDQAARIAAAALLDTMAAASAVDNARVAMALAGELAGATDGTALTDALADCTVLAQRGDSLGERIAAAHADVAARFPGSPVLQIGMDTPQVDADLLGRCAEALRAKGTDAVLGKATDGGWWALGLRDPLAAACVRTVPMSTPDTGDLTEKSLLAMGLRVTTLPVLSDVDTVADACRVADVAPRTRFAAAVRAELG